MIEVQIAILHFQRTCLGQQNVKTLDLTFISIPSPDLEKSQYMKSL
jgi:hypothetical protein